MTSPAELLTDLRAAVPDSKLDAVNIRPVSHNGHEADPVVQIQHAEIPRKSGQLAVEGALIIGFQSGVRLGIVEIDNDKTTLDIALKPEAEEDPGMVEKIVEGSVLLFREGRIIQNPEIEIDIIDLGTDSVEHRSLAA